MTTMRLTLRPWGLYPYSRFFSLNSFLSYFPPKTHSRKITISYLNLSQISMGIEQGTDIPIFCAIHKICTRSKFGRWNKGDTHISIKCICNQKGKLSLIIIRKITWVGKEMEGREEMKDGVRRRKEGKERASCFSI